MSRIGCKEARVIDSTWISNEDLRSTLNTLCDQIENGLITNMDMTLITMGLDTREITVSSIRSSAQRYPTKVLPNRITTTSAQAIGVDEDQLFSAYNLLCDTVQPLIYLDDRAPNSKAAMLQMGASEYPIAMVPNDEVVPDGTDDEEVMGEDDDF